MLEFTLIYLFVCWTWVKRFIKYEMEAIGDENALCWVPLEIKAVNFVTEVSSYLHSKKLLNVKVLAGFFILIYIKLATLFASSLTMSFALTFEIGVMWTPYSLMQFFFI